ncbi:hypothetical protein V8E53_012301 [Lactarius tabidus]
MSSSYIPNPQPEASTSALMLPPELPPEPISSTPSPARDTPPKPSPKKPQQFQCGTLEKSRIAAIDAVAYKSQVSVEEFIETFIPTLPSGFDLGDIKTYTEKRGDWKKFSSRPSNKRNLTEDKKLGASDTEGQNYVLKDFWLEKDRKPEHEIYDEIIRDVRSLYSEKDADAVKQYLFTGSATRKACNHSSRWS